MDTAAIEALFAPWAGPGSPGVAWAVTLDGREVHDGAAGLADIPHAVPMDRRTVVRIGSQTKQFTVLLALMLEAEGRLSLDDEVHRYAPWLPAFPHTVTLRHLATNTSGLRDFLEVMTLCGISLGAPASRARQREVIARHAGVNFVPGTEMIYCNTNFWLLSGIIEEVSGRSFNELLAARITGPLGMADTRLLPRDSQVVPRLSAGHARGPDGAWETARWGWDIGGEGGMVSTVDDMLRWQANLRTPRVGADLLPRMMEPVTYANGVRGLYAMGLIAETYRGRRCIGHGGSVAGGRSESLCFPEAGLGIVILANLDAIAPYSLALRIADIVLGDRLAPHPAGAAALPPGLFRWGGELLGVTEGGDLASGTGLFRLHGAAGGRFVPERPVLDMTLAAEPGGGLDVTWCGQRRTYRRVAGPAAANASLAGRYASGEAGLVADVADAEGGATVLLRSDFGVHRVEARWVDEGLLGFVPDTVPPDAARRSGTLLVDGGDLVLTTDRTKGLRLRRIAAGCR